MTPYVDTNEAPETWITAAPMDTLTSRDGSGIPTGTPQITVIPVRYHLYWAGADKDGSIGGFYYAVVETTVTPDGTGYIPSLPAPKPGDYRFTSKTDTTFVFNVSELYTDRQHAFYLYAVDDKGKPDPTPAKFVFRALDKYPPTPVIDQAQATGKIVRLSAAGDPIPDTEVRYLTHVYDRTTGAVDTAAAYSQLDFAWHAEMRDPFMTVGEYRFKLDESAFRSVDASVHSVSYGADPNGLSKRSSSDSKEDRWHSFHISEVKERNYKIDSLKWLKDDSLDDADSLPEPEELAVEAIEELRLAVDGLQQVLVLLENGNGDAGKVEGKK